MSTDDDLKRRAAEAIRWLEGGVGPTTVSPDARAALVRVVDAVAALGLHDPESDDAIDAALGAGWTVRQIAGVLRCDEGDLRAR